MMFALSPFRRSWPNCAKACTCRKYCDSGSRCFRANFIMFWNISEQKCFLFISTNSSSALLQDVKKSIFFLGRGRRFFCSPNIQTSPGTHPILLFNGYRGIFLWGWRSEVVKLNIYLHLVLGLRMTRAIQFLQVHNFVSYHKNTNLQFH